MKNSDFSIRQNEPFDVDLDTLLRPALAFEHPRDVVGDPDLTLNEQRAILASWASDACAVAPALRCAPGTAAPVPVDESSRRCARSTSRQTRPTHGGIGIDRSQPNRTPVPCLD